MEEFKNKNVQILSIEAKDLITKRYEVKKKQLYIGSLDDSIEVDELKNISKKIIKENKNKKRYYSDDIITVTFKYACNHNKDLTDEEYERVNQLKNTLDLFLFKREESKNKIKQIKETIKNSENEERFSKIFNKRLIFLLKVIYQSENKINDTLQLIKLAERRITREEIRQQIYQYGFNIIINGKMVHFKRYKRSGGSARVGKCLFINEKYHKKMINWSFAGLKHKENQEMDCSSMEAYISLSASSCIDRFNLLPENILLIEDGKSTFTDTVMATRLVNEVKDNKGNIIDGDLDTNIETTEITNKIWDGENLLDKSIFEECGYDDKAILQIRNRFFKGIGINTDIQGFFKDNNITSIEQLNGKTIATDISQIKLITTPSSIKYLKYGTFDNWLKKIVPMWGICKYEKPQHHFNEMVQTHYQLINTLGMSKQETKDFLDDTIRYINYLKNDVSVLKYHLGLTSEKFLESDELKDIGNTSDFVLQVLSKNDDFINTKIGSKFRKNLIDSYIRNTRKGHILVNGNYSVVISCPYEFLLESIGKWDKKSSILKPFECCCSKFDIGKEIVGVRSPQPTMSNMCVFNNTKSHILDKYFNTESKEVIILSSIDNNVFELESSMDVDGDAMEVTDNKYIVNACKKLNETIEINGKKIKRFLVPTDFTPKASIKRKYNWRDLADVDIKCSSNKIGEIINLAQMLNSIYWHKKNNNLATEEELLELYKDICQLDILSCIEIDRCKKLSPVNAKKELDKIRAKKYLGKGHITRNKEKKEVGIRPYFFKYLDGGKDYKFKKFDCGMDYLEEVISENVDAKNYEINIPLTDILICGESKCSRMLLKRLKDKVLDMRKQQKLIWSDENVVNKYELSKEVYNNFIKTLDIKVNDILLFNIFDRIYRSNYDETYSDYKYIGKSMLNILYDKDKNKFLSSIKIKQKNNILEENKKGNIDLYGLKFIKNIEK